MINGLQYRTDQYPCDDTTKHKSRHVRFAIENKIAASNEREETQNGRPAQGRDVSRSFFHKRAAARIVRLLWAPHCQQDRAIYSLGPALDHFIRESEEEPASGYDHSDGKEESELALAEPGQYSLTGEIEAMLR